MDFAHTPEDEAFRDELRSWLDESLPKFLADWGGDEDYQGGEASSRRQSGSRPRKQPPCPPSRARPSTTTSSSGLGSCAPTALTNEEFAAAKAKILGL